MCLTQIMKMREIPWWYRENAYGKNNNGNCIVAQAAMIAYGNNVIPEEKNDKIYNYLVRPITSESVFMGVLIPSLFMIKVMAGFFFGNDMFFLNGAMIVAIILYVVVEIYES